MRKELAREGFLEYFIGLRSSLSQNFSEEELKEQEAEFESLLANPGNGLDKEELRDIRLFLTAMRIPRPPTTYLDLHKN